MLDDVRQRIGDDNKSSRGRVVELWHDAGSESLDCAFQGIHKDGSQFISSHDRVSRKWRRCSCHSHRVSGHFELAERGRGLRRSERAISGRHLRAMIRSVTDELPPDSDGPSPDTAPLFAEFVARQEADRQRAEELQGLVQGMVRQFHLHSSTEAVRLPDADGVFPATTLWRASLVVVDANTLRNDIIIATLSPRRGRRPTTSSVAAIRAADCHAAG